jgi:GH24 family phage-related lysozyme (muramidase)
MNKKQPRISDGIGRLSRDTWAGGRPKVNPQDQLTGFYIGQVMDDRDEQRMSRVWVYIPEVSVKRFDTDSQPLYGGITPDQSALNGLDFDQRLRLGWLLVSPVLPFFGADDFRNASAPDGRNSVSGDVNSYGMFVQPRIGDFVAVMFAAGDPNSGYWIGMVPKKNRTSMVPGSPGIPVENVSTRNTNEVVEKVAQGASDRSGPIVRDSGGTGTGTGRGRGRGRGAGGGGANRTNLGSGTSVPVMDHTGTPEDPLLRDQIASTDLSRNVSRAGLAMDTARGAGTAGSQRESPSYVSGMKSAGWSYDSEKSNRDQDGQPFENRIADVYNINSTGHNFIMDDHPDHQGMRMRTSSGAQITMNDVGGFIYISTQTGNAWIEVADSGNIAIFSTVGVHVHTEGDYNLTVDGNMNIEVKGSVSQKFGGDYALGVAGIAQTSYQSDMITAVTGEYHFNTGANAFITYSDNVDISIGGTELKSANDGIITLANNNILTQAGGDIELDVRGELRMKAADDVSLSGGNRVIVGSGGNTDIAASGQINLSATGNTNIGGATINLNPPGGITTANTFPSQFYEKPIVADLPILPTPKKSQSAPSGDQVYGQGTPEFQESVAPVVPQHQPWNSRAGYGDTAGTNGMVTPRPVDGAPIPRSSNNSCNRNDINTNIRSGAGFPGSGVANSVIGGLSSFLGALPLFAVGKAFTGSELGEAASVGAARLADPLTTHYPADWSLSSEVVNYIKSRSSFMRTPQLDPFKKEFLVGFGKKLKVGEMIGGTEINSDFLSNISSFANDAEKGFEISPEEADSFLMSELGEVEGWLETIMPDVEITQGQYDALISFAHNVGIENILGTSEGLAIIAGLQGGNFDVVQDNMYKFAHVGGAVDCSVLDRRRQEVSEFGTIPDRDGVIFGGGAGGTANYAPDGQSVTVAGFTISAAVLNAICNANSTIGAKLPDGYLLTICAQESRFDPRAQATTSSAAGLFQFIKETGAQYGLSKDRFETTGDYSSNVYNAIANANAGAQFAADNLNYMESKGLTNLNATDMYLAHFLGAGGDNNGAVGFLKQLQSNPNGTPGSNPNFVKGVRANPGIYGKNGERTYAQVYALMQKKIEGRLQYFKGMCNAGSTGGVGGEGGNPGPELVPPGPPSPGTGLVQWFAGIRSPDFTGVGSIRTIVENSASQAGISTLGFNSGFRSPASNTKAKGAKNSQHLYGTAIDIHIGHLTTAQKRAFVGALIQNGATGLGVGTNTIHADNRAGGRVTWTYNGGNAYCVDLLNAAGYR